MIKLTPIHFDTRTRARTTVYATQVTTKALQAAKRKEQAAPVNKK
jgi:hypothetical protein